MATNPKFSKYFGLHEQLNRRLREEDHKMRPGAEPGQSQTIARPRGSPPGALPLHLTAPQRQALIDLVKANPDSLSEVIAEKFEEATGREVSKVTVNNYRRKITTAKPQP